MSQLTELEAIDWKRLFQEFSEFQTPAEASQVEAGIYVSSLVNPAHTFVSEFLAIRMKSGERRDEAVRDLYHYLLQKRYDERLNLLHFAFHIFDEETRLPDAIIEMTPFPHEDGVPRFKHFTDGSFRLSSP